MGELKKKLTILQINKMLQQRHRAGWCVAMLLKRFLIFSWFSAIYSLLFGRGGMKWRHLLKTRKSARAMYGISGWNHYNRTTCCRLIKFSIIILKSTVGEFFTQINSNEAAHERFFVISLQFKKKNSAIKMKRFLNC